MLQGKVRLSGAVACKALVGGQVFYRRELQCCGCIGVEVQLNAVEECNVIVVMLYKEVVESLCNSIFHPRGSCFIRVDANVCFRVAEVRVKVYLVVGICRNIETYLVGLFNHNSAVFNGYFSVFGDSLYAYGVLHSVIVKFRFPYKAAIAVALHCALRYGVGRITECEVLHSGFACAVLHCQHIGRVRYKVFALEVHAVSVVLHHGNRRVQRENALVVA